MSHSEATLLAYGTAATETAIAIAVLAGFARKTAYLGGAAYSLVIWAAAEGFGGPYQAGATDIGTAIIYTFVFLGLLILAAQSGPDEYCVDRYLERRLSWWVRIAEVRPASRSLPVVPTVSAPDPDRQHSEDRAAMGSRHR
jgi:nitrite reductase (NO-forming)